MKTSRLWLLFVLSLGRVCSAPADLPVDAVAGPPPGVIVTASQDPATQFVGSPCLIILPDGRYLASYDMGGKHPRAGCTGIAVSGDRGMTWEDIATVPDQKWSTLFHHRGAVWLIGIATKGGNMQIRRSADLGRTWTAPVDERSGLLARGRFHCAPTPVVVHGGRIWRAFEQFAPTGDPRAFLAFVMSAPADADLLDASVWTRSNALPHRPEWLGVRSPSWLEGNIVVTPEGGLVDVLRVEAHPAMTAPFALPGAARAIPRFEVAAAMDIAPDGRSVRFDPARGFIHFIGSEAKFTIRYDAVSRRYWTVGSKITNPHSGYDWTMSPHHQRNVLSLASSADLREWREEYRILRFREGQVVTKAQSRVGFQYADWQFDGPDLILVCRLAWNGANYHDANYITFHRVRNFRTAAMADSPADLARPDPAPH